MPCECPDFATWYVKACCPHTETGSNFPAAPSTLLPSGLAVRCCPHTETGSSCPAAPSTLLPSGLAVSCCPHTKSNSDCPAAPSTLLPSGLAVRSCPHTKSSSIEPEASVSSALNLFTTSCNSTRVLIQQTTTEKFPLLVKRA